VRESDSIMLLFLIYSLLEKYWMFRKTCNIFDVWYIRNFLGYRNI